jgi:hypothetical protein
MASGAALAAFALFTGAIAAAPIELRPGLWQVTTELWIDGNRVLADIDAAGQRAAVDVLRHAREQIPLAERAEFDRAVAEAAANRSGVHTETECIAPQEARVEAQAALEQALQAVYQPPWTCGSSGATAAAQTLSFSYRCQTAAGARAEGQARFEASSTRYRHEITGRSHAVDMQTGKPHDSRLLPVRSITTGRWLAQQCER